VSGTRLLAFELQVALAGGRRHDLIRHTIATLVARQIEQYIATRQIGYLMLEASAPRPLRQHCEATCIGLHRRFGGRHAEQRQAFLMARPTAAVKLQIAAGPEGQNCDAIA
jgi:hypothetical protein